MKKLLPLFLLILALQATAQDTIVFDKTVELESNLNSYDSVVVKAINSITFKPGFSYSSGSTKSLSADFIEWNADQPDLTLTPGTTVGEENDLDGGFLVGTIAGQAGVSPSGAATYTIPLTLPPGTKGVVPQLSINYNSQSGNGLLGRGWNLGGLSSIVAIGKTRYYDNETTIISSSDTACRVLWDGQRLLALNNVGLEADSFRTEMVSNVKITTTGSGNTMWFTVKTPDGLTMEYGNSTDSRLALDATTQWQWMLNKVYDRNGNTITYTYTKDENIGEILLDEIKYGGESSSLVNSIKFHFSTRTDISYSYIHDDLILKNKLLDSISIKSNNSYYGSYGFAHSSTLGESLLSEIIQFDKDNNRYNATKVDWESPSFNINATATSQTVLSGDDYQQFSGDFTGDGIFDLAVVELDETNDEYKYYLYEGSVSGLSTNTSKTGLLPRSYTATFWNDIASLYNGSCTGTASSSFDLKDISSVFSGDFDGDGIEELYVKNIEWDDLVQYLPDGLNDDIIASDIISNGLYNDVCNYSSFIENPLLSELGSGIGRILNLNEAGGNGYSMKSFLRGDSYSYERQLYQFPDIEGFGYNPIPEKDSVYYYHPDQDTMLAYIDTPDYTVIWGEFNGDGKADYISSNTIKTYQPSSNSYSSSSTIPGAFLGMIDLNGDGINGYVALTNEQFDTITLDVAWDLWCPDNGGCDVSVGSVWTEFLTENDLNLDYYNYWFTNRNCGLDDSACREDYLDDFGTFFLSKGYELFIDHLNDLGPRISLGYYPTTDETVDTIFTRAIAVDINADQALDLMVFNLDTLKEVFYDFQPSFSNGEFSYEHDSRSYGTLLDENAQVGDYNGDGIQEIVFPKAGKTLSYITSEGIPSIVMGSITNGLGIETRFNYLPLTNDNIYTKENDAEYPVMDLAAPWYVTSSVSTDNGVADSLYLEYTYSGAKIHLQGKGFLGFMTSSVDNDLLNTKDSIFFNYDSRFYQAYPVCEQRSYGSTNVSRITNSYSVDSLESFKYRLVLDSTKSQDLLKNITTTASFDYNENTGLVEEKITQVNSEATITESLTYTSAGWHVAALPASVSKEYKRGSATSSDSTTMSYSSSNGNLIQKKDFCGTDRELTLHITDYDSFGNIKEGSLIGKRNSTLVDDTISVKMSYSSDGRFLLSRGGLQDFNETFQYNTSTGSVVSRTGSNRKTTSYEYGPFYQIKDIEHPDYINEISILTWASEVTGRPTGALFYKWDNVSGSSEVLTFYDETGRDLRTISKGFDDDSIYIDTEYDTKGRILKKSLPYFSSDSPVWTTYTYDSYGRILTETSPDTTLTTYIYDDATKKVTTTVSKGSNTYSSSKTTNSLGELIQSTDNLNNTVYYAFLPDGKLDSSYVGNHSLGTSFEYDAQGNRTSITDPDAGTITSLYDAYGNLLRQVNAKRDTSTFVYDDLGRIISSNDSRGDIYYSYISDTTHAAFGQMDSVYNSDKTLQEVYTYDQSFGRLLSQSNTQVGKTFTHSYTYDPFGRPETRTYPSGFEVQYSYTSNGYLNQVKGDGLTLWSCSDVNAFGQIKDYSQGSYSTSVNYNSIGELNGVTTSGDILDWAYSFDDFGNLASRYDGISDQKEVFTYDNLNRLTGITYYNQGTHDSDGDLTISFDDCGNITSKSGLSTDIDYGEFGFGPHALTTINSPDASYTPPPQDITYNCFNKVESITDTLAGGTPLNIAFSYGLNNQRVRTTTTRNSTIENVKYFDIDYEEDSTSSGVKKYHYIHGGNGLCAIFVKEGTANDSMYHVFSDHLGSLTAIVNASTSAVKRYSFNAWGVPREASDWTTKYTGELIAGRGFTGHEHLMEFNLINMNGRIYDPVVGRFLSPDPFVQAPDYPNNFNRYSYALNNPLKFTDPSGYTNSYWDSKTKSHSQTQDGFRYRGEYFQYDYWSGEHYSTRTGKSGGGAGAYAYGGGYYYNGIPISQGHYQGITSGTWYPTGYYTMAPMPDGSIFYHLNIDWVVNYSVAPVASNASNGGEGNDRAHVISIANGMAALGPIGAMGDMGAIVDSEGDAKMYLTFGWAFGFGATAGVGYSTTTKHVKIDQMSGRGEGTSLTIPLTPIGGEVYGDWSNEGYWGKNYKGGGVNIGIGAGWFGYISFTFVFPPPPTDFWSRPGSRR